MCTEDWRQVMITIQGAEVQTDLFVLAMGGANVVLGVQWLETLGDITINHKNLTMEFTLNGRRSS